MNPARITLATIGGLLLVIGGIVALVQKAAADKAAMQDEFGAIYGLDPTAGPAWTAMWIAVVVAGIGAVMLIGLLIAVAAQPKTA